MKIILLKDIDNLGEEGDIVSVKDGYGANFLLPKKLATVCNDGNLRLLEKKREVINKRKAEKKLESRSQKEKIESLELTIPMQSGDRGRLYGSITPLLVANRLSEETGISLNKKQIEVPKNHIKSLGIYRLKIKLYEDSLATLKINVIKEETAEVKEEVAQEKTETTEVKTEAGKE